MATGNAIVQAFESGAISPDEAQVKFVSFQCRTCDEHGPWVNATDHANAGGVWDANHAAATGHDRFYLWSMTRNTARVVTVRGGRGGAR